MTKWYREFFRLVCQEPDLKGQEAKQYKVGYKKISKEMPEKPLNVVYSVFADGYGADWKTSRRLLEKEWSDLLGAEGPLYLDIKNSGTDLFVRFRRGPDKSPLAINEQIVDPTGWEALL
jgi:hypothetical protein